MRLSDFFDTEFKEFSNLDNVRSIPSLIDGLKDSQRKAIYGMMQRPLKEIKVAQAAGEVSLCLHKDTLVLVKGEYIKIKDLYESRDDEFEIESFNIEGNYIENDTCEFVIDKGETKELIEIELENGETLKLTPDHKVFTKNGWIKAKDLTENCEIKTI